MDDVVPFGRFLCFALLFALLVYLQFYFAHRQWRRLKGGHATEIDTGYVLSEDYLAQSFRAKLKEWLKLPESSNQSGERIIVKGREKIRVTGALKMAPREVSQDILVTDGDFSCGEGCTLTRELNVRGNAQIGERSRLQAVAADGKLDLGERVKVARWLDSCGELTLGAECEAGARATSATAVRLADGVKLPSVCAPQVSTVGWDGKFDCGSLEGHNVEEFGFPESPDETFVQLGADCWLYRGDLRLAKPARITRKLVVRGDCEIPERSVLETDLKASGSLSIGPNSVVKGNLIAEADLRLGPGCQFSGLLQAGKSLLLSRGVRGFRDEGMVAVYGAAAVLLEADVAVKGKIASGGSVRVVAGKAEERTVEENGWPVAAVQRS